MVSPAFALPSSSAPGRGDALLARIAIDEADDLASAKAVQRLRHVVRIVHRAVEIVGGADIVVDADDEAVKLGGSRGACGGKRQ